MAIIYSEDKLIPKRRDGQINNEGSLYVGGGSAAASESSSPIDVISGDAGQVVMWDSFSSLGGSSGFTYSGKTAFIDGDLHVSGEVIAFYNNYTGGTSGTSGSGGTSGTSGTSGSSGTGATGSSGSSGVSGSGGTSGTSGTSVSVSGQTGQVVIMNSATTLAGTSGITFSGSTLIVHGSIVADGEIQAFSTGQTESFWSNLQSEINNLGTVVQNSTDVFTGTTKTNYIVTLSAAEYSALSPKDAGTIYFII